MVGKILGLNFRLFAFSTISSYTQYSLGFLKDDHLHMKPLILTEFDEIKGNEWQCDQCLFLYRRKKL